ncbi:TPA: hypothetical protein NVL99_003337 [Acinetobacter baumannii]|nr:hypothetical protein [Acinetobacter baumannii]HCJ7503964.1 hypothetical protein [Acinetobacter baumannii]
MKIKIIFLSICVLGSTPASAEEIGQKVKKLFGINSAKPVTNPSGNIVETEIDDPLSEFTLLNQTIVQETTISDIPGRIVAICQKGGNTYINEYGNNILKDNVEIPKVDNTKMTFESLMIDTKSAANLGFLIAQADATQNYRVEYNLFRGPTASVKTKDIDSKKFAEFSNIIKQIFKDNQECKLKDIHYIETASIIYQNFKSLKKNDATAKVTGPGWNIDGSFYSTNQSEKNQTRIAVKTISYLTNNLLIPIPEAVVKNPIEIQGNRAISVDPKSIGNLGKEFKNVFKIQ